MLLGSLLLFADPAAAWVGLPTGTTFKVECAEPRTNTVGGPPELTKITIYYRLDTGAERSVDVAPTSPAGGGTVTQNVTVPILPGQVGTIHVQCTAWNASTESARTPVVSVTADRRFFPYWLSRIHTPRVLSGIIVAAVAVGAFWLLRRRRTREPK